jgi:hypothetical protein
MARKNNTQPLAPAQTPELLPPVSQTPEMARLIQQVVEKKIADAFSQDDLFRPFFENKKVSYEIRQQQTVAEKNKWIGCFEDYGCIRCDSKTAPHRSLGLCAHCYNKISHRLQASMARRAPAPGTEPPTFMDSVKLAREALRPALAALAADNEVELAVPGDSPRLRTQGEAADEAGISHQTLMYWLKAGKVEHPKEQLSEKRWLWSDEDIARLKELKGTNPPGHPKTLNIDAAQVAQLRTEGKSWDEIGQILGCSAETARRALVGRKSQGRKSQ